MDPSSPVQESTPIRGSGPPEFVLLEGIPEGMDELAACARRAGCRLFREEEGRGQAIVAGDPGALERLRSLLAPDRSLDRVREAVERRLAHLAAPDGLPHLREEHYRRTEVAEETPVPAGTTMLVTREFTFDAAHNLPRYHGKCERLHGHTYRLRVTVKAPLDRWSGMAFDFHDLKKTVYERVVRVLDHRYVNEIIPNPSAEYMAVWAWEQLSDLPLFEIQVGETPTSFVTYHGPPGPRDEAPR